MAIADVTVVVGITDKARWGKAAGLAAFTCLQVARPAEFRIATYAANATSAVNRKYDAIQPPFRTKWVLHIDADAVFDKPLNGMIAEADAMGVKVGARHSPLQERARVGWRQDHYEKLWQLADMPYCKMATTCAVLVRSDYVALFERLERWRRWVNQQHLKLARVYHHAQAAFTLACGEAGIRERDIWWFGPKQVSWPDEEPGIIVHGARKAYKKVLNRWLSRGRLA